MKKYYKIYLLATLTLLFFNSCKKETVVFRAKPQILVSGGGSLAVINGIADAAIVQDTTIRLVYTISTEESIKSLTQTVAGVVKEIPEAVGKKTHTVNVDLPVSLAIVGAIKVSMFVTDNNNLIRLEENIVNVKLRVALSPPKSLVAFPNKELGGNASPNLFTRMNFETGLYHGGGTITAASGLIPLIDVAFNDGKFSDNDASTRWPNGMGSRFSATNITAAQFNGMSNDLIIQATSLTKVKSLDIKALVGKVIYFETNLNNKGVILIKTYDAAVDEVRFDYKITN